MDDSRYLECLSADYGDLRDAATAVDLTAPVPNCPGWTMSDLVFHVAEVYLHKVTLMRMPALRDYTVSGPQFQQRVLAIAGVRWPYPPGTPPGSTG